MPPFAKDLLRSFPCLVVIITIGITAASSARAEPLILNGDFETGDLSGWTLAKLPLGDQYDPGTPAEAGFFAQDSSELAPLTGLSALPPATGNFFALADMTSQGTVALLQSFTMPLGEILSAILHFDMYVYDWYGAGAQGASLDHRTTDPIQHARVDLLRAGADPFSTDSADVVANLYHGVDPRSSDPTFTYYRNDLLGLLEAGQTYQLRFAVANNLFVLNQGIDDVRLEVNFIPEPATLLIVLSGLPLAALAGLRRRAGRSRA